MTSCELKLLTGTYPEEAFDPVTVGPAGLALPVFARGEVKIHKYNLRRNNVRTRALISFWVLGSESWVVFRPALSVF